jgi:hypothetical protein
MAWQRRATKETKGQTYESKDKKPTGTKKQTFLAPLQAQKIGKSEAFPPIFLRLFRRKKIESPPLAGELPPTPFGKHVFSPQTSLAIFRVQAPPAHWHLMDA